MQAVSPQYNTHHVPPPSAPATPKRSHYSMPPISPRHPSAYPPYGNYSHNPHHSHETNARNHLFHPEDIQHHRADVSPMTSGANSFADAYARAYAYAATHGNPFSQYPTQYPSHPMQQQKQCPYGCHGLENFGSFPSLNTRAPPIEGDDDLSKLLLSWYQSGYYAGRYKAIQDMKRQAPYRV
jgi:hypothetical protein